MCAFHSERVLHFVIDLYVWISKLFIEHIFDNATVKTSNMKISTINVQPALWLSCMVFVLFYFDLSFSLLIDVPYPVTKLDFKGGCSYINLTWSQPSSDAEGGKVTGYLAQVKLASSEEPWLNWTTSNVSQSSQSYLFTQLKPNSEYYVTIMAQNKMGYGWPSEMKKVSTIQAGNFFRKFVCLPLPNPTLFWMYMYFLSYFWKLFLTCFVK